MRTLWLLCVSFLCLIVTVALFGCGLPYTGGGEPASSSYTFVLDAVKGIRPEVTGGDHPGSYGQAFYEVGPSARLLLRYELLDQYRLKMKVNATTENRFWLKLGAETDATEARDAVEVCPVLGNWMMLATWTVAHPFGAEGIWRIPGGDYEGAGCRRAKALPETPGPDFKPDILEFDLTDWYEDYFQGRGRNEGWLVTSSKEGVRLAGERSPSRSPRIRVDLYLNP